MNYPPTDSLYKFCAIFGLIIIGFSVYYPEALVRTLMTDIIDVSTDLVVLEAEDNLLESRIKEVKEVIQNSIARQKGTYKHDENKLELTYSDQELKRMVKELDQLLGDKEIAAAKAKTKHQKTQYMLNEIGFIKRLSIMTLFIGIVLDVFGFYFWYARVQRFQDKELKDTATKENTRPNTAGDC